MKFITREEWRAVRPRVVITPHVPTRITIHHQGGTDKQPRLCVQPLFRGSETIRNIQKYHMEQNAWVDIGYHRIIAPNGDVYEGRKLNQTGAHVKNRNTGNIGIMLIGNFEVETPTKAQLETLKLLIKEIAKEYPTIPLPSAIYGHKEFMYTDCPGRNLYPFVLNLKFGKEPL